MLRWGVDALNRFSGRQLAADWLPAVLSQFRSRHPGIGVRLFDAGNAESADHVRRGDVDFAITTRVETPADFCSEPLFYDEHFLVCAASHSFASRKQMRLRDLQGCDYIHSTPSGSMCWIRTHLSRVPFNDTGLEVRQMATLCGLVANGFGVTVVPGLALAPFLRRGLIAVPLRDRKLRWPLLLVRRRGVALSVAAEALRVLIAQQLAIARGDAQEEAELPAGAKPRLRVVGARRSG